MIVTVIKSGGREYFHSSQIVSITNRMNEVNLCDIQLSNNLIITAPNDADTCVNIIQSAIQNNEMATISGM
jgi:hypothetical protein